MEIRPLPRYLRPMGGNHISISKHMKINTITTAMFLLKTVWGSRVVRTQMFDLLIYPKSRIDSCCHLASINQIEKLLIGTNNNMLLNEIKTNIKSLILVEDKNLKHYFIPPIYWTQRGIIVISDNEKYAGNILFLMAILYLATKMIIAAKNHEYNNEKHRNIHNDMCLFISKLPFDKDSIDGIIKWFMEYLPPPTKT
jgi:hypothetical protein